MLARHGLLVSNPRKRPPSSWRRFCYARPRDCYQIDATEITLAQGTTVVVFDVIDDCTRLLVACRAARSETALATIEAVTAAFGEFGASALVLSDNLSDNGSAFTYREHYNTRRRHSAIGRRTPRQAWDQATVHAGPTHLPVQTDATVHQFTVTSHGTVYLGKRMRVLIGRERTGHTITIIRDGATAYTNNGDA